RLRVRFSRRRSGAPAHVTFAGSPFHISFRKKIASFERREIVQTCCRIKRRRVPVRAALKPGTDVRFTVCVRFQVIQNGPALCVDSFCPVEILQELLTEQKLSICPVQDIKKSVSIGLQQKFAWLSAPLCIDEDRWLLRIPIVNVVRSELEMPSELSGFGFERKNGIAVQVVALPLVPVVVETGIARRPVQEVELRIVGPRHP